VSGCAFGVFLFFEALEISKNNFSLCWQSKFFCNFWSVHWLVRIAKVLALGMIFLIYL